MNTYTFTCRVCGREFEAQREDARHCSGRCRAAAHRKRTAERKAAAHDLLERMTEALASGADAATLAELQRQAARLLG